MGMPKAVLVFIYLFEAILVWLPGVVLGWLCSWGAGVFIERWLFFAEARHAITVYYGGAAV